MTDKQQIKIKIAGHPFDISVGSQEEEMMYRQAEKQISERFSQLQEKYVASEKELLAMCLLSFVSEQVSKKLDYQGAIKEIEKLSKQIQEVIA